MLFICKVLAQAFARPFFSSFASSLAQLFDAMFGCSPASAYTLSSTRSLDKKVALFGRSSAWEGLRRRQWSVN